MTKALVIMHCNANDFHLAAEAISVNMLSVDPWRLPLGEIGRIQFEQGTDVFKKLCRRYYNDQNELCANWNRAVLCLGEDCQDAFLKTTIAKLGLVFC